ncbi:MAG: putative lipid II flippase FtsW [Desulfitobacteriaceae bacterium]|nr:putative lipid II flippase FtsW [Desulfitobacteriaceae bacterium]MDD4400890.1 putative lipid II flippase FtsW [Desulfitobacteriaceae bacterium]
MRQRRVPKSKSNKAVRVRLQKPDFYLFFFALALLAFGLLMVLDAGAFRSFKYTENAFHFVLQQLRWALIGCVLAYITIRIPFTFWKKYANLAMAVSLGLLIMVFLNGIGTNGSVRWVKIAGIQFQPSEFCKLALIVFYAKILDRRPVRTLKDLIIPLGVLIPVMLLVFKQPDLGTTMVIGLTAVAMLLQTELPTRWFAITAPVVAVALYFLIRHTEYQWQRILVWFDPWKYAANEGLQVVNAQIAFGTGGIFGVGLGQSLQKFGFLPENYTDTIFAIVGEEFGFLGSIALIALFVCLFVRCYKMSRLCPDRFGRLLGYGITSALAIQTVINLAVVTGVMPLTGITLPLISYGGSSLSVTLAELGIILNISRYRKPKVTTEIPQQSRQVTV